MALFLCKSAICFQRFNQSGIRQINKFKQFKINLTYIHDSRYYCTNYKQRAGAGWRGVVRGMVPLGLCLVAVMQWRAWRRHSSETLAKPWQVQVYCALPLRIISRTWGWLAERKVPEILRPPLFSLYASAFGVNLDEAESSDLRYYPSMAAFFSRGLRENARPQDSSPLTSPCDGTVLYCGPVKSNNLNQVKGVTYSLVQFIADSGLNSQDCLGSLLLDKTNKLYQIIVYLAPGDYHRFHSPCDWKPCVRRHISGELLSVSPRFASWLPGLFCLNERTVYAGQWSHGFFSLGAVGATNVGSVRVYMDPKLRTNTSTTTCGTVDEVMLPQNVQLRKGDPLGEFRMGSTIVLVFEAPENFRFRFKPGQNIRVGQAVGNTQDTYVERVTDTRIHSHSLKDAS